MTQKIPFLDLQPEISGLRDELSRAIEDVVSSGQFILGPVVADFERRAAEYLQVAQTIGVNSGTDALKIALKSCGVGAGDEVITSSFTFFATAEAISQIGGKPIFVDIEPGTFNIDAEQIKRHLTSRTKALMPVHLFGQAADMEAIGSIAEEHGLPVIEDAAQAFGGRWKGKRLGAIGTLGAFSFFPSKTLGAFGDGGLVTTDDKDLAAKCRMLRFHGSEKKYYNTELGWNSRLDAIQAAVLRVKLPHQDKRNEGRRRVAARYDEFFRNLESIVPPPVHADAEHVYHQYTIRVKGGRRDALRDHLSSAGIPTMVYYPVPVHRLPVYQHLKVELPEAERAAEEVLSLPIWPELDEDRQQWIVDTVKGFFAAD